MTDSSQDQLKRVKSQIIDALSHPEADEGLYFRNFSNLHEEDERPAVQADEVAILDALQQLIGEGKVRMDETGEEAVFIMSSHH